MSFTRAMLPSDMYSYGAVNNTVLWWDREPYRVRHHSFALTIETKAAEPSASELYFITCNFAAEPLVVLSIDGDKVFCGQAVIDVNVRGKFTHIVITPIAPTTITIVNTLAPSLFSPT